MIDNFSFQYPYLAFLVIFPSIIFKFLRLGSAENSELPVMLNPNINQFSRAFGNRTVLKDLKGRFNYFLFTIWVLLVLAIMHPQKIEILSKTKIKGYDIMLAVDLSKSMQALDFATKDKMVSRLDVVKQIAKEFIDKRKGDRLGLILFGENAYLQSPLTLDTNSISKMLELSEVGIAGDATAVGDAIAMAVKFLKNKTDQSRILILMTDGANTSGRVSPLEAAKLAKDFNIKIYTIGVGKKGAVPYPSANGSIIFARIQSDDKVLKKIADVTSGKFFSAEDKETLESVYNEINQNEKSEEEVENIIIRKQLYQIPLIIAFVLLLYRAFNSYNYKNFNNRKF